MTSPGCSMRGPSKKGNSTNRTGSSTILNSSGDGICFIFKHLGIPNRTKPGKSEFALRAFLGCFRTCSVLGAPPRKGISQKEHVTTTIDTFNTRERTPERSAGGKYLCFGKIPTPIKIKLALPPPLPQKTHDPPPLKGGILWAWGFSSRKKLKIARRP